MTVIKSLTNQVYTLPQFQSLAPSKVSIPNLEHALYVIDYILNNRQEFESSVLFEVASIKFLYEEALDLAVARSKSISEKLKGRSWKCTTTTSQDVTKVAKALGVSTSKTAKSPTLVQAGAQGTGKRK